MKLRHGLVAAAGLVLLGQISSLQPAAAPQNTAAEIRGLWVLRSSLTSPSSIATLVGTARAHGFNTLLVQVRGRGDAYFNGGIEPRAEELKREPASFDPLATVLASAHKAGLRVHAWVNVNLISSAVELPAASAHVVNRHPEWLMVPRELAPGLLRVKEKSRFNAVAIARWIRAQNAPLEGLYVSPIVPEAADHVTAVVRDIVTRYQVDGVHLDYARYPSEHFDYSRAAIREFRAAVRPKLTASDLAALDTREAADPLIYPDMFPEGWKAFRIERMTTLMSRLRATVKSARASAMVTVATAPDLQEARDRKLQDWGTWLRTGLVDAVCPMAYTPEAARFAEQIAAARDVAGGDHVWAGIGAYRLSPEQTIQNIETARKLGTAGVVLFSYDSLRNPYLGVVGRTAFARSLAPAGTR